jgi:heme-degrading monooxygenase HmoA
VGGRSAVWVCRQTSSPLDGAAIWGEEVALYGTVARLMLKPGVEEKMMQAMERPEGGPEGHVATYVFKSDVDPDVHFVTTIFESKSAYKKFADSPEQDKRFHQMRELLAADPEWHDGEVIHHDTKVEATR